MSILVRNATRRFGDFTALDDVSVEIPSGSLTALLGPSGSGKSTLLRVIAGLERPDAGSVEIDGRDATALPPQRRGVGFVFQHYAAFKHMTVRENVAFGLKVARRPKAEIKARVDELLELVQLPGLADRYPAQLSGGQRQRMALARSLATQPSVLLLDEPFGALDARVRKELRAWLRHLHDEVHVTTVFVTHDQEEAMEVADRIVVMNHGRIEQVGGPRDLYEHPANAFVMGFFSAVALVGGLCLSGYTVYVWRHRKASAGASLAVMLAAAGWWGVAYALELAATRLPVRLFWGDAKWLGIALLPPAFYAFVMQYTGRPQLVNRRTMAALAVVPVATVALLAIPATHDLVRSYPPGAEADPTRAIAQVGPLFWPFLVYANLVLWGSTGLFVWTLTRVSRRYWRQSLLLIMAGLLPSVANLAHNLNLGPFRHVELTPFLFVLTGTVLVWGLFRFQLLDLTPAARTSVFETMLDAALVLDPYRRVG